MVDITRKIWDREIAKLLTENLEHFEEEMRRKGINAQEELGEYLDSALEEVQ